MKGILWESFKPYFILYNSGYILGTPVMVYTNSAAHFFGPLAWSRNLYLFLAPGGGPTRTRTCLQPSSGSLVLAPEFWSPIFDLYEYWSPSFNSPVLVPQFWLPSSGFPSSATATEHWWMAVGGLPGIQLAAVSELLGRHDAAPPPALQIMALSVRTKEMGGGLHLNGSSQFCQQVAGYLPRSAAAAATAYLWWRRLCLFPL